MQWIMSLKDIISLSTKAVVVGDGGRSAKKQQLFEYLDCTLHWDNLQDIVRFYVMNSKKPDVIITVSTFYSRRANGVLDEDGKGGIVTEVANLLTINKALAPINTKKQKGIPNIQESRQKSLEICP